jgi:hypothetical protein
MDKRISSGLSLAIILSSALFIGGFLWWSNYQDNKAEQRKTAVTQIETKKEEKTCPVDAQPKLCPDGNYVERGPDCEFSPCPENIVGSDKDEHGCIGSAGYTWCGGKQKCLRVWEEECGLAANQNVKEWKIYVNEKYAFEFKYPSEWKLKFQNVKNSPAELEIFIVSAETEKEVKEQGEYPSADVIVDFYKSAACLSGNCSNKPVNLKDYLDSFQSEGFIADLKEIDLNGIKAYEADQVGMGGHHTFYLENNNGIYQIDFTLKESRNEFSESEKMILLSFKLR